VFAVCNPAKIEQRNGGQLTTESVVPSIRFPRLGVNRRRDDHDSAIGPQIDVSAEQSAAISNWFCRVTVIEMFATASGRDSQCCLRKV
jgi:hypothetical protein